ncbi:hypothetical protein HYU16_04490 [Candidatus Woesearchaeota archaeon]|nr:hypothetical protein [Candidatus Woesearchaeota archaeon]
MPAGTSGKRGSYMPFAAAAVLIVGIILLLVFDKLPFAAKPEAQAIIENQAEQLSGELQPVSSYVSNDTGNVVVIYAGTISKISKTSITLTSEGKSKELPISKQTPPDYIVGKFGDASVKRVVLTLPPGVGATVTHLFLLTSPSGEKYVSGVFIKPD